MAKVIETIENFAKLISSIQKSDRWVLLVASGEQGEGKSCFTSLLAKETAKLNGTPFSYEDNMTYMRKELKTWVDGKGAKREGRKPEFSVILADEIISMFFKRNWFDSDQIDGIELMNKCRDRHLCMIGNLPSFWDLDSAIFSIITFWVHIDERGTAWIFQKSRNPFTIDKWNRRENEKRFNKKHNPYSSLGFVAEVKFPDWNKKDKKAYYKVRNFKRRKTEGQRQKMERYGDLKKQRDELLKFLFNYNKELSEQGLVKAFQKKDIADIMGLSPTAVGFILRGER